MAKILLIYFSCSGEAMYGAMAEAFRDNKNDVFRFNINHVGVENKNLVSKIIDEQILLAIKSFEAEIVLSFNNALPLNCYEILPKKCKICIIDADSPEYFWNKAYAKENSDIFYYIGMQSYSKQMYESFINKSLDNSNRYFFMPMATSIKNEKLMKDKEISFIGSNFHKSELFSDLAEYELSDMLEIYKFIKEDYFCPLEKIFPHKEKSHALEALYYRVKANYVRQDRLKQLQILSGLGLVIFGDLSWKNIEDDDLSLANSLSSKKVKTLEENEWVYNTSKIAVNISHPQAKTAFSWRVMDIMASNACLLMEDKPDWHDLFAKYISQEVLKAVIYKDIFDMRVKAKLLLENDDLREKCVRELNYAIEKNGRWQHRLQLLETVLDVDIIGLENENLQYTFIEAKANKETKEISAASRKLKLFFHSLCFFLMQVPPLSLFKSDKADDKYLKKIQKHIKNN